MPTATAQPDSPWNRAKGDMNGDGEVDAFDSSPYSAALSNLASYHSTYPMLDGEARGDVNDDGSFDSLDTTPFGNLLSGSLVLPFVSHAPTLQSRRSANGIALNDIGHQGLMHDEEFQVSGGGGSLVHNRARTLHPGLGRFVQRDPLGIGSYWKSTAPSLGLNGIPAYTPLTGTGVSREMARDDIAAHLAGMSDQEWASVRRLLSSPLDQYLDGPNVYQAYRSNPISNADWTGQCASWSGFTNCVGQSIASTCSTPPIPHAIGFCLLNCATCRSWPSHFNPTCYACGVCAAAAAVVIIDAGITCYRIHC